MPTAAVCRRLPAENLNRWKQALYRMLFTPRTGVVTAQSPHHLLTVLVVGVA